MFSPDLKVDARLARLAQDVLRSIGERVVDPGLDRVIARNRRVGRRRAGPDRVRRRSAGSTARRRPAAPSACRRAHGRRRATSRVYGVRAVLDIQLGFWSQMPKKLEAVLLADGERGELVVEAELGALEVEEVVSLSFFQVKNVHSRNDALRHRLVLLQLRGVVDAAAGLVAHASRLPSKSRSPSCLSSSVFGGPRRRDRRATRLSATAGETGEQCSWWSLVHSPAYLKNRLPDGCTDPWIAGWQCRQPWLNAYRDCAG